MSRLLKAAKVKCRACNDFKVTFGLNRRGDEVRTPCRFCSSPDVRYRVSAKGCAEFLDRDFRVRSLGKRVSAWVTCAHGFSSPSHARNWVRLRNARREWEANPPSLSSTIRRPRASVQQRNHEYLIRANLIDAVREALMREMKETEKYTGFFAVGREGMDRALSGVRARWSQ